MKILVTPGSSNQYRQYIPKCEIDNFKRQSTRGKEQKNTSFSLPVVMLHIYVYTRKHHKKKQNGLQEEINETTLKPCRRAEDNMVLVFLNTKIDLEKEKIVCKTNWNLNWVLAWLDYPASNALMERLRRGVKVFSVRGLRLWC